MHEHIICDITRPKLAATGVEGDEIDICNCWQINYGQKTSALKYKLNQVDIAIREIQDMVEAGGRTVVELTCGGLKPRAGKPGRHLPGDRGPYRHGMRPLRP